MSAMPASSALCYMVVNPGLHTPHKNKSFRCSTWGAFVGSLELHYRTRCKTMMFSQELVFHPCSHSYINVLYAGWAMLTGWKMGASLSIYSMASSPLGLGVEATNYASRMYASAKWKYATSKLSHGKPLQTEPCRSNKCHKDWKEGSLPSEKKWWQMGQENSQSTAGPPRLTSGIYLHMPGLQQRLQIQDWPLQPHKRMLTNDLSWHYSIC